MDEKDFLSRFLSVPVAVNNLYGDPFFPTQTDDTFKKLEQLRASGHKGVVGIITKSELTDDQVAQIRSFMPALNIVVLVSMSGLDGTLEHTTGHRENSLARCIDKGIPCIAYLRPFIPKYNTSDSSIRELFARIHSSGAKVAVLAGLRGNDEILAKSGINSGEERREWSYRVKIVPKDVRKAVEKYKGGLLVLERTSCGIAYVLGMDHSYNPYYFSPQLARCYNCPLESTCHKKASTFVPDEKDMEFLQALGYQPKLVYKGIHEMCHVDPAKRTECVSCCTGCFITHRESIELRPDFSLNLGDISFCRHLLGGKLVHHVNTFDHEEQDIAHPKNPFLSDFPIYMLNSWWSFSRNIRQCYNCTYCIVTAYDNADRQYGSVPLDTGMAIWDKLSRKR
jgi:hypothetical protein